jgi:hypothetical protein
MERITGPYRGYFIAAYAVPQESRFAGHAWICTDKPETVRDAHRVEQVSSVGVYANQERAVQAAEYQARFIIDGLDPNWEPFTNPGFLVSR